MANLQRTDAAPATRLDAGRLVRLGVAVAVVALLVNLLIFFIANAVAADPIVDPNSGDELPVVAVILSTILGVAAAVAVFALVVRRLRRSVGFFTGIAVAALLLSLLPILTAADVATATRVTLTLMHVVTAAIVVGALTTRAAAR